jgi:hypothetical protein
MADKTECPKCGKKTVVQRKGDLYECLHCDFDQGFSEPPQLEANNGFFWTTVITALLAIFFLQVRDTTSNTRYLKTQSFPEPIAVHRNTN